MMPTARLDGGRRGVDTTVVGWWYYWWGCEVLLVDPHPPSNWSLLVEFDGGEWDILAHCARGVDGATHRPQIYG